VAGDARALRRGPVQQLTDRADRPRVPEQHHRLARTVALVLLTAAMAAYPLARMRFPGRDVIFVLFVGSLMIPTPSSSCLSTS